MIFSFNIQPFLIISAIKHDGIIKFGTLVDVFWKKDNSNFFAKECVLFEYQVIANHDNKRLSYLQHSSIHFDIGPNEGYGFTLKSISTKKAFVLDNDSQFTA
ncbi:hypothetical protein AYI69_g4496 [Smittium culicis]|uniref:Uncharacterized protein n=1 Tax=Smittium culicis TaxID=133412 RepID=A0A1R1YD92_9FUNG|nr:hypothetical protein AYI69_g4496 [Smittium culicis]